MAKHKPKHNLFLLSWDMTGLESVIDLTTLEKLRKEDEKKRIFKILSDPDAVDPGEHVGQVLHQTVQSILMRARVNSHRHYEVYTIQTTAGITEQTLRELFEKNPQHAAELIRERGNQLYSGRISQRTQLIT